MDIFAAFSTDQVLESTGKWFSLSKTAKVLVARSGNQNYADALRESMGESPLEGLVGREADEVAEELLVRVMSNTILLGWKGLSYQGKEVPYSAEMARTMLRIKDFRKKIASLADNFEAFRIKEEVAQGNG